MATKKTAKGAKKSAKKSAKKGVATKKGAAKKNAVTKKSAATGKGAAAKKTSKVSASKAASKKAGAAQTSQGTCGAWNAISNRMPPGPATFYVTGQCTFPTPGYKVKLVKAVPQGINPDILLLRKVVTPPDGPRPAVLQTLPVRYDQKGGTNYTHVTILPEGTTVKVQIVV